MLTNTNNYSNQLEQYRQSGGNICAFLNITMIAKIDMDTDDLAGKFAAFEVAGFRLSSSSNNSFLELLVPSSIQRQFTVSRCAYERQLSLVNSKSYQSFLAVTEAKGLASSSMLPQLVLPSFVAMLAVLFNISLLVVITKKISMSTVCNWLLAFDSLCQIPALLPFLVNLYALCARLDAVDHRVCLATLMLSTGSSYASFLAVYLMSLERFLIVAMPMRMSQLNVKSVKKYSLLAFVACTCFGVAMLLSIFNVKTNILIPLKSSLYCNSGFYSDALNMYGISHAILGLALLNYVFIACLICWRRIYVPSTRTDSNNNAAYSQATHRMLRSVFLISLVLLIGWLSASVLRNLITRGIEILGYKIASALFHDSKEGAMKFTSNFMVWALGLLTCLFPVAAGINAPILIINTTEYRKAYKRTLAPLFPCRKKASSTAIVGPLFT